MKDFVTEEQFYVILALKIILGVINAYLMYRFAVRNPTNYDTIYRKRMRYVYGGLCCILAISSIVLLFHGPFFSQQSWYYLSTYGTVTPSRGTLETGISANQIVRAPGAHCIWGRQTFEQWSIGRNVVNVLFFIALAIYFFAMKRSSVRWFAKVRKAIGYVLLLTAPAQINTLHYFDIIEIIV